MTTFSKILARRRRRRHARRHRQLCFRPGHGGYRSSYGSYHSSYGSLSAHMIQPSYDSYQPSHDYNAYDDSGDYGYGSSYGWDHHGGYGHFCDRDRSSILAAGSAPQRSASRPFCFTTCKSFNAAPVGWRSPH